MLCERCKIREANIQYTEIVNGVRTEHNYCTQCAKEMDFGPYSAIFEGEFPLGKLLSGLLGVQGEADDRQDSCSSLCYQKVGKDTQQRIGRNTGESIRSSAFQSYAQLT